MTKKRASVLATSVKVASVKVASRYASTLARYPRSLIVNPRLTDPLAPACKLGRYVAFASLYVVPIRRYVVPCAGALVPRALRIIAIMLNSLRIVRLSP